MLSSVVLDWSTIFRERENVPVLIHTNPSALNINWKCRNKSHHSAICHCWALAPLPLLSGKLMSLSARINACRASCSSCSGSKLGYRKQKKVWPGFCHIFPSWLSLLPFPAVGRISPTTLLLTAQRSDIHSVITPRPPLLHLQGPWWAR